MSQVHRSLTQIHIRLLLVACYTFLKLYCSIVYCCILYKYTQVHWSAKNGNPKCTYSLFCQYFPKITCLQKYFVDFAFIICLIVYCHFLSKYFMLFRCTILCDYFSEMFKNGCGECIRCKKSLCFYFISFIFMSLCIHHFHALFLLLMLTFYLLQPVLKLRKCM